MHFYSGQPMRFLSGVDTQLSDVVTTNVALAQPGVIEANPLIILFQQDLGLWWLPKAVSNFSFI